MLFCRLSARSSLTCTDKGFRQVRGTKYHVLNSKGCCPGLSTGKAAPDKAGHTLVVVAFTRRLRLADEERTAHLSSSVRMACVFMLDHTSTGSMAKLACDLRRTTQLPYERHLVQRLKCRQTREAGMAALCLAGCITHDVHKTRCDALVALVLISATSLVTKELLAGTCVMPLVMPDSLQVVKCSRTGIARPCLYRRLLSPGTACGAPTSPSTLSPKMSCTVAAMPERCASRRKYRAAPPGALTTSCLL